MRSIRLLLVTVLAFALVVVTALVSATLLTIGTPAHAQVPAASATTPAAAAPSPPAAASGTPVAPRLFDGYGNYHRTISTVSPEAQRWFDQGIQLLYGFNHDEAIRSFRHAAEIDPNCLMAWWGIAYANGHHINNPEMTEEQTRNACAATAEAQKRIDLGTPAEQALVRAVAKRYVEPPPADRKPLDVAYADAMGEAWRAFPDDPDIGALYAESLMDLQPWDLWTHDGEPKGRTLEIVAVLEAVLARTPRHPGANHFYIHAVEASPAPEKGLASADRFVDLVPGAGHLVHMPSHIYIRTGRYADAADANVRAIDADTAYFAVAPPPRFYNIYYLHNLHFLAYASMMEGRSEAALEAARRIEKEIPSDFLEENVKLADAFMPTTLHVLIRFGKWEAILEEPEPESYRLLSRAMRHYARGIALANLHRTDEARAELAAFNALADRMDETWLVGNNPVPTVLPLARSMFEGELAFHEGRHEDAFAALRRGVAAEDLLVYDEPPGWMQPVRHALGALLIADGQFAEAESVYREDLRRHPNNGWSVVGLQQALRGQDKVAEAEALDSALATAFPRADVAPKASCYCQPGAR
ncbi:MAG: hypothetical protein KDA22_11715 [Phycisphaerales bacterium]|nr:hypothetical protein [Phycisphaerales bacterium]